MRALLLGVVGALALASAAHADVWVPGHYTSSGQWVDGYFSILIHGPSCEAR